MSFVSFRDSPHEFIITVGDVRPEDFKLFFDTEEFVDDGQSRTVHIHFDSPATWERIAVHLGMQPSLTEARKNGWHGPVEWGYSERKRKLARFYILSLPREDARTEELNSVI